MKASLDSRLSKFCLLYDWVDYINYSITLNWIFPAIVGSSSWWLWSLFLCTWSDLNHSHSLLEMQFVNVLTNDHHFDSIVHIDFTHLNTPDFTFLAMFILHFAPQINRKCLLFFNNIINNQHSLSIQHQQLRSVFYFQPFLCLFHFQFQNECLHLHYTSILCYQQLFGHAGILFTQHYHLVLMH